MRSIDIRCAGADRAFKARDRGHAAGSTHPCFTLHCLALTRTTLSLCTMLKKTFDLPFAELAISRYALSGTDVLMLCNGVCDCATVSVTVQRCLGLCNGV